MNRVSLGVQALNDPDLRFLGRLHDVAEALKAIDLAREIFPRLSFDLIYARPGQTQDAWAAELERAIGLAADHLSLYQLTIEEGTRFFDLYSAGKLKMPDADTAADLYALTQQVTAAQGLPAYEISNHARPGRECRHNLVYWRGHDYAGKESFSAPCSEPAAGSGFTQQKRKSALTQRRRLAQLQARLLAAKPSNESR